MEEKEGKKKGERAAKRKTKQNKKKNYAFLLSSQPNDVASSPLVVTLTLPTVALGGSTAT
jgi:hypothetical protein